VGRRGQCHQNVGWLRLGRYHRHDLPLLLGGRRGGAIICRRLQLGRYHVRLLLLSDVRPVLTFYVASPFLAAAAESTPDKPPLLEAPPSEHLPASPRFFKKKKKKKQQEQDCLVFAVLPVTRSLLICVNREPGTMAATKPLWFCGLAWSVSSHFAVVLR
jgi:hypothetical protein